jgi:hypothetical protein
MCRSQGLGSGRVSIFASSCCRRWRSRPCPCSRSCPCSHWSLPCSRPGPCSYSGPCSRAWQGSSRRPTGRRPNGSRSRPALCKPVWSSLRAVRRWLRRGRGLLRFEMSSLCFLLQLWFFPAPVTGRVGFMGRQSLQVNRGGLRPAAQRKSRRAELQLFPFQKRF